MTIEEARALLQAADIGGEMTVAGSTNNDDTCRAIIPGRHRWGLTGRIVQHRTDANSTDSVSWNHAEIESQCSCCHETKWEERAQ